MIALSKDGCLLFVYTSMLRRIFRRHVSTLRIRPTAEPDVQFQKNMVRTSRARSAIQMMEAAERGKYHSCLAIAANMKAEGIRPDYSIYSALIQAAAREARWLDAWAIFDDMLLVGIKPTVAIFNHLLHVCYASYPVFLFLIFGTGTTATFFTICMASY